MEVMYNVVKRDGQIVSFDISKIAGAIKKGIDYSNTFSLYASFVLILIEVY